MFYSPILVSWTPPTYIGSLSSVSYKVSLRSAGLMDLYSSSNDLMIDVVRYSVISVGVTVYHESFGEISLEVLMTENLDFVCYGYGK